MNQILMDNPFAVGDLVHIPQGTTLYRIIDKNKNFIYTNPQPIKVIDIPKIGYIIDKSVYDFYIVGIENAEYMIKSYEMNLTSEKLKYAY